MIVEMPHLHPDLPLSGALAAGALSRSVVG